ncbi:MAG: hypothetical protein HY760_04545, partial [Nitrospirae bacterium]|nr:hypothetical protein [Nitrospirota bacterium]
VLPPGGLPFAFGQGGVLCGGCPPGGTAGGGVLLSGAAIAFLRQVMKIPLPLMDRHLPTEGVLREVRGFLDGYTRFLTGKEIPARRFVDALSGVPVGPS